MRYRYAVIRSCIPNARVIRIIVAKAGLPSFDKALLSLSRLITISRARVAVDSDPDGAGPTAEVPRA